MVFLRANENGGRLRVATVKGFDVHLLYMEYLGFFNPVINCGGDGGHGENHSGDTLVYTKGELINESNNVSDGSFAGMVLEVCDVFLESIVNSSIRKVGRFLDKFGQVQASSGFGVKGVKCGLKVVENFLEHFLIGRDSGVSHLVIPHFSEGCGMTFTHLVECCHDLVIVSGV